VPLPNDTVKAGLANAMDTMLVPPPRSNTLKPREPIIFEPVAELDDQPLFDMDEDDERFRPASIEESALPALALLSMSDAGALADVFAGFGGEEEGKDV